PLRESQKRAARVTQSQLLADRYRDPHRGRRRWRCRLATTTTSPQPCWTKPAAVALQGGSLRTVPFSRSSHALSLSPARRTLARSRACSHQACSLPELPATL